MKDSESPTGFAAFSETVFDDFHLLLRLRPPRARPDYIADVVALGAERGFVFEADDVWAAMREGEQAWLMQGVEVVS